MFFEKIAGFGGKPQSIFGQIVLLDLTLKRVCEVLRMTTVSTQIEIDARGVAWLTGANVKVIEVVMDKLAHGWSPEEIHLQHTNLSLAQIHAALAYYYENQTVFDRQIEQGRAEAAALASKQAETELGLRLQQRQSPIK